MTTKSLINKVHLIGKIQLIGGQNDGNNRDGEDELTRADMHPKRHPRRDGTCGGQQSDVLAPRRYPHDQESETTDLGRDNRAVEGGGESIGVQGVGSGRNNPSNAGRKKTKVVIDTNVFISATFWRGPPSRVLELVESEEIELLISHDILAEFIDVLAYPEVQKKAMNMNLEMRWTLKDLSQLAKTVYPSRTIRIVLNDPDDDKIIECAVEGKVDFIISQDKHLLKLGEFEGIKIVSPMEFLKRMMGRGREQSVSINAK